MKYPLLFIVVLIAASCGDQGSLIGPGPITPAGKATVDEVVGQTLIISWACDTVVDPVWTIFYGMDYRFQISDEGVLFSHYKTKNSRMEYLTSEVPVAGRVQAVFRSGGGACGLYSEVFDDVEAVVRIYKGDVYPRYPGTSNARYVLSADGGEYPIAFIADGLVRHRDFYAIENRDAPRPMGLTELQIAGRRGAYYLPVNFNVDALDGVRRMPKDDRPYLVNPICGGDGCMVHRMGDTRGSRVDCAD